MILHSVIFSSSRLDAYDTVINKLGHRYEAYTPTYADLSSVAFETKRRLRLNKHLNKNHFQKCIPFYILLYCLVDNSAATDITLY